MIDANKSVVIDKQVDAKISRDFRELYNTEPRLFARRDASI
jgi:hypothetical protein